MLPPIFAEKRRWMLSVIVTSALCQGALAVFIAFQMRLIFASFAAPGTQSLLPVVYLFFAALGIILLRVGEQTVGDMLAHSYIKLMRVKLFDHVSRLSHKELLEHRQGSLQIRYVGDLSAIQNWVGRAIPSIIAAAFLLPALLCLLYWLHPTMALTGILMAGICLLLMFASAPALKRHHEDVRGKRGQLASYVSSRITIAPILRIMGLRRSSTKRIESRSRALQRAAVYKSLWVSGFKSLPEMFLQGLTCACILLAFQYNLKAPEVAMILAIVGICHQPLSNVASFWDRRNAYLVSRRKCYQLLATKTVTRGAKFSLAKRETFRIRCRDVVSELTVFPNFSVGSHQSLLIHGPSGCGKSTLMKLIVGLNRPPSGKVTINNRPITQLTDRSRLHLFHYLTNQVPIFTSTLKQTLTLGLPDKVSAHKIEHAIKLFQLLPLASRLNGLNGKVLEQGKNLSDSEKIRVACCRAYLSRAKFILIDDLDGLVSATDSDIVRHLINKEDSSVIACTRHPQDWQISFSKSLALEPNEMGKVAEV